VTRIPFNLMTPLGREAEHVQAALRSGQIGGGGAFAGRCEARLQEILSRHPVTLAEEAGILEEAHRLLHDALA